jgi:uncharacterized protein YihD (DUF1040 family)
MITENYQHNDCILDQFKASKEIRYCVILYKCNIQDVDNMAVIKGIKKKYCA